MIEGVCLRGGGISARARSAVPGLVVFQAVLPACLPNVKDGLFCTFYDDRGSVRRLPCLSPPASKLADLEKGGIIFQLFREH